jgi:hypothetical protein
MNSPKLGLRIASAIFGLFGLVHLIRVLTDTEIKVGTYQVALWPSVIAVLVAVILCGWMWRLASMTEKTTA